MFRQLPSLTSIRTFESAARLLSFKAAAGELNVSPTAVSHQIRGLEHHLNIKLFERKTRAVVLTPDGEKLAVVTHQLMKGLLNTVNELTSSPNAITVGTTNAFAALWLVPNLADFQRRCPDIEVTIRAEDSLIDIEHDRRVDLVIRSGRFDATRENVTLLYRESLGFFATPAYWQRSMDISQRIFYYTRWKNPALEYPDLPTILKAIYPEASTFDVRDFDDENQTIQAALSGQGIAVVSQMLVKNAVEQGWLCRNATEFPLLPGLDHYCLLPQWNRHHVAALQMERWLKTMFA